MGNKIRGRIWVFGNNISSSQIHPEQYFSVHDKRVVAQGLFKGVDYQFTEKAQTGDIVIGGTNFGCGSSRETTSECFQLNGINVIVAESFARIFYRNSRNLGMLLLEAPGVTSVFQTGEVVEIDLLESLVRSEDGKRSYPFKPLDEFGKRLYESGGLYKRLLEEYDRRK